MRFALLAISASLFAQSVRLEPPSPRQGDALRVFAPPPAATVRLGDRQARLFPQPAGMPMAIVAVPVIISPGEKQIELLDVGGTVLSRHPVRIRDARFRKQNVVLSAQVASLKPAPGEMEAVEALRKTVSETRYWDEPFAPPVPGCMTSPFGVLRMHNGKPTGNYHGGLDQRGAAGTPIHAASGGLVKIARMFNVHGGTVGLDHGHGVTSTYLHMSAFAVKEGTKVQKGDVIGYVGTTGRSTAPHLHWGIAVAGYHVNPSQWVSVPPCAAPAKRKQGRRR